MALLALRRRGEAINGWTPRRADTFEKIDKIGQGTYSNVYKARDTMTGKIVALKKVRFDNLEPESVKFMAREILILRRLDHPNVVKLEEHGRSNYMHQLLSGLEHCHNHHVLHRDIKGSNLLIGNDGILRIADFGLASFFDPNHKQPMTSRVEQLHKIFKLCGSPSEEYWKKSKLPHATIFKPQQSYKRCIAETFKDFPPSSLPLIETLLAIDPAERQTATAALKSEFFSTKPYACEPSSLPNYPPSKEMDAKLRDEEARRLRAAGKANADGVKKSRPRDRAVKAFPAPEANAELQANLDRRRLITHANAKSKSEKFPPPHQDGTLGYPLGSSHHIDPIFDPPDVPFSSTNFSYSKAPIQTWSGPLVDRASVGAPRRKKQKDRSSAQLQHLMLLLLVSRLFWCPTSTSSGATCPFPSSSTCSSCASWSSSTWTPGPPVAPPGPPGPPPPSSPGSPGPPPPPRSPGSPGPPPP
ncbi:hypothetical protein GH714_019008 [Hevea brasiliensis]|uniref:Protein kinase domain-containing protein n=1 Tax=Hevea brasiliensis TaxID=3981 RepID=A0A6A6MCL4_HEVBR|nr:hypothetical protein GH714_019008 [Hevea brasiliensis]